MIPSENIIDVTESDFDQQVLAYSYQNPVIADFWAEWCAPCRVLAPILEKLTNEAHGAFRLAKVNVDTNPKLAMRYDIRSIPVVKIFKDGTIVSEFVGAQPEARIREIIQKLIPSKSDLLINKANSLLHNQPVVAEEAYLKALEQSPDNSIALLGLSKSLFLQGRIKRAIEALTGFPASRELQSAEQLLILADHIEIVNQQKNIPEEPLEAAYMNSLRLVTLGNIEAAMDGLLDLLKLNKNFKDGAVKQDIRGLLELMDENDPQTRQYRNEFASILF